MEIKMKCPCCKSEIVIGPKERYETLSEHVSDPNSTPPERPTLICSNNNCVTRKHEVFWDNMGDLYGGLNLDDKEFIGQNNSPFGSLGRRLNVEIYKVGLKKKKYLSPKWLFGFYQPVVEWNYKANEDGEVLKTWLSFSYLKKDGGSDNYCIGVTPFWITLKFLLDRFKRNRNYYNKNKDEFHLRKMFEPSYNRANVYRIFESIVQVIYFRSYNEYIKLTNTLKKT